MSRVKLVREICHITFSVFKHLQTNVNAKQQLHNKLVRETNTFVFISFKGQTVEYVASTYLCSSSWNTYKTSLYNHTR